MGGAARAGRSTAGRALRPTQRYSVVLVLWPRGRVAGPGAYGRGPRAGAALALTMERMPAPVCLSSRMISSSNLPLREAERRSLGQLRGRARWRGQHGGTAREAMRREREAGGGTSVMGRQGEAT